MLTVHYYRPASDYQSWRLRPVGDVDLPATSPLVANRTIDSFGAIYSVPLRPNAQNVRLTIERGTEQGLGGEVTIDLSALTRREVWLFAGGNEAYSAAPALPVVNTAIIYYRRADNQYTGWGLYPFGDTLDTPPFNQPLPPTGQDAYGAYFTVRLKPDATQIGFIIHNNGQKDPGPDQFLRPVTDGRRVWVVSGDTTVYRYPARPGIIDATRAHWVSRDTIAWNLTETDDSLAAGTFQLHYAPEGGIRAEGRRIVGGSTLPLRFDPAGLSPAQRTKFPHLASYRTFKLAEADLARVPELLKGQLLVSTALDQGRTVLATGLQIPGVLDELYTYDGPLGVSFDGGGAITLRLWAPTARSVKLHRFADAQPTTTSTVIPMTTDASGVWTASGDASWKDQFYLYEVEVFVHSTGRVERNLVTDPYSFSLSTNSQRSQIVDLNDPALAPPGWDTLVKPAFDAPEETVIYELHVRDFSASDPTVPAPYRGTFMAFTLPGTLGTQHLRRLASAGISHVHLLPTADFATVNEDRSQQLEPGDLTGFAANAEDQQAAIDLVRDRDAFNWGYDPLHFTVPEGSYATDPDGPARIREFRSMVQALNAMGLRVVIDVVYNHTSAAGQDPRSIFDRIVPGYYHRLDERGAVANSTCCANTASEHAMFGRFMVDSVRTWATAYKVDGFRFDLMGHHFVSNMVAVRDTIAALRPETDGVDGRQIYIYGEGWDLGEVANNARGMNATQLNLGGQGIGTFNDRIRDAVRGGGPFDSGTQLMRQGVASGLFTLPNALDQGTEEEQKERLLGLMDWLRVGLTGNLRDYQLIDSTGETVLGSELRYNGFPVGYTTDPQEVINYASAHDNETLFDIFQYKAPEATDLATRVRMHNLALSFIALGQGVPFFLSGEELLRSKSLDRDSFNSGDWFNRIDFSYQSNNWGIGLPPRGPNERNWSIMRPLLADPTRKPAPAHIQAVLAHFEEMLRIRRSSPLFRLRTAADVMARLTFHNTGPDQVPGLLVMSLTDQVPGLVDLDPLWDTLVVIFNATPVAQVWSDPALAGAQFQLHPVQVSSADAELRMASFADGSFTVPPWTTAVFVQGPGGSVSP